MSSLASKGEELSQPIIYVDKSTVREGQHTKLKSAMKELAAFVETNMPRVLTYAFHLREERSQMTVVALHPDSASAFTVVCSV